LGGRFTTIEGLLTQVRDDLRASIFDTEDNRGGDSMVSEERTKWSEFFERLDLAIKGEVKFTVVLEDPLASSYIQSFTAPEPDSQITVVDYERTHEEEENLGLNDIKVEGYTDDVGIAKEKAEKEELDEIERARRALEKIGVAVPEEAIKKE